MKRQITSLSFAVVLTPAAAYVPSARAEINNNPTPTTSQEATVEKR